MQRSFFLLFLFIIVFFSSGFHSTVYNPNFITPSGPIDNQGIKWVDSVFNTLSPDERIAQLLMIRAHSDKNKAYVDGIADLIKKYNIGGLCFFQGGPIRQINIINHYQSIAKTPLLISIDGEWGLGMRLDSVVDFPRQMTLGAIQNNELIYEMGKHIGTQCKLTGIHLNFAPVIDVNNNPLNPVINSRSFGENKELVAKKGIAYMKGMQDNSIIACGKHFPGHGDTKEDSHKTLPIITNSKSEIEKIHLYPFKRIIENNPGSIMIAHLFIPAYDNTENTASTLSKAIVTDLLREKLNFNGLIITDALEMQGVAKFFKPGILEVKALQAGNDILLLPNSVEIVIDEIKKAIEAKQLSQEEINLKCKKILAYKYYAGLSRFNKLDSKNIYSKLNDETEKLNKKIYEEAITLIKNKNDLIPLKEIDTLNLAYVSLGGDKSDIYLNTLKNYSELTNYQLSYKATQEQMKELLAKLKSHNLIIVAIQNTKYSASLNYGISQIAIDFINQLKKDKKIILSHFGNPYFLSNFKNLENIEAIMVSYQDNKYSAQATAHALFGGIALSGILPVSVSEDFPAGKGIHTIKTRMGECSIEEAGLNRLYFSKIDSIIENGINQKAFPGCQIFVARNGNIIYNKPFGKPTYESKRDVKPDNLYDLASLTKIFATTFAIMKLHEEKKIDIDESLGNYLPILKGTNKENILIRDVLSHQARLLAWIPFYKGTMINGKLDSLVYNSEKSIDFPYQVCEGMFISKNQKDTILKRIVESELLPQKKYLYSDLGFILLKEIIENICGKDLDIYCSENFYRPLGLSNTLFSPLSKFERGNIIPTELDTFFRKQLIQGFVHDQACAMTNGVNGHAGLFSTAQEIGILMEMLLRNGEYGGQRYFKESTVKEFTKRQFPLLGNRRGLGFDKPLINGETGGPTSAGISEKSFGHQGFTGTYAWADPSENLVFVFLSNRIYPSTENKKINELNVRTNIQQAIYEAIKESNIILNKK